MTTIRVATWNLHGLRAGVDAIADVVDRERPDLLLVQESGSRLGLRRLGERVGMPAATDPVVFPRRRVRNAVLVRPPLGVREHRLVRFRGGSWLSPRGAMIAGVDGLTVVSLHLGLRVSERRLHVRQLLDRVGGSGEPVVIGGDLNARPDDPASVAIAERYPDAWPAAGEGSGFTMPASRPAARIDAIFAGPAVRARSARTAGATASDHLMVVVDLELG